MELSPPAAPPQMSPDGHWWWDGLQWTPARRSPASTDPVPEAAQPAQSRDGAGAVPAGLTLATRELRTTEVGGVQTLWAPGEGMVVARLQFRVGQADERLPIRGVTHLAEHLAFERLGQPTYSHNASVSMETTSFDVAGTQDEVSEFLRFITAGLHDPPIERLAAERHLLKVESQHRGGVFSEMASVRHGARGHGLSAYLELGLEHLRAEDLRMWAKTWFTADNAVLWMWGGDPQALELSLPRGERFPLPRVETQPLAPRSWFQWGDSGIALTFAFYADRGTANAASWWLQRHLAKALRHDAGLAYSVKVEQHAVGACRQFSVVVDGLPDRSAELRDAMLLALEGLGTATIADADLAAWKREMNEVLTSTDRASELSRLDLAATGLLLQQAAVLPCDVVDQCLAVTADGVAAVVRGWQETCLLAVPTGVEMPAGWALVRRHSTDSVLPERVFVPATRALEGHRLLVAHDGVTAEASPDVRWTVRWRDCAAVLRYADGSLTPIGSNGVSIPLVPGDWIADQELFRELERHIEPSLVVPLDSKPSAEGMTGLSGLASVSTGLLSLAVATFWFATLALCSLLPDQESGAAIAVAIVVCAALSVGITWSLVVRLRAPKKQRLLPQERSRTANYVRRWLANQAPSRLRVLEGAAWALTALLVILLILQTVETVYPSVLAGMLAFRVRQERQRVQARAIR